jgi:magnesium-transporting ATPase (P-type)
MAKTQTTVKADADTNRQWHAMEAEQVLAELETSTRGISDDEARRRLEQYGPNLIEAEEQTSALVVLVRQFRSPLIYILVVAAIATLLLREFIDTAVIAAVLILNAIIGFTQERRAEKSIQALKQLVSPRARVVRNGREYELESADLVPGDLVLFESGTRVPADVRIISASAAMVDESLLTGESVPVQKRPAPVPQGTPSADRTSLVYAGTIFTSGRSRGIVVETGTKTALGEIAEQVRGRDQARTPLQERMDRFAKLVGAAVLISTLLAFALGIAMGISASEMFLVGVGIAVAAVPEGLPIVFTITLAIGVHRMAQRNAIIRSLPAVETLGSTTVIGSDKTGTLTENRMTVQRIWTPEGEYQIRGGDRSENADDNALDIGELDLDEHPALRLALYGGVLTNEAEVYTGDEGVTIHGDPTEAALLISARHAGLDPSALRSDHDVVAEIPFEPDLQYSASLRNDGDRLMLYVKGAPERVLQMCTSMQSCEQSVPLDHDLVTAAAAEKAAIGLRVLAIAVREISSPPADEEHLPEPEDLTLVGLQGMLDPPREGVREAIAGCQSAGMRVLMITGDHAATAKAIGHSLGIADEDAEALTGVDLDMMGDAELEAAVERVSIFARVSPAHKLRVVEALQHHGHVVGVTGDGVNDAPALKAADIGIAMGKSGTDVAREASDMVLADDNFVSIYSAVEQGRITFDNVRKVTFFLISTGVAAIITILTALVLGWPLPFVAAQLLWLNLVTNGLQDVALAFEPGEPDTLKRPPRERNEGIISRLLWERTAIAGIVLAAGTLLMFWWELEQDSSMTQAQTVALTTMVIFQMFHVGNARSDYRSAFRVSPFSNPFLLVAVAAAIVIHVGALYFPLTQFVLRVEPIPLDTWIRIIGIALSIIVAVEIHKFIRRPPRHHADRAGHQQARD